MESWLPFFSRCYRVIVYTRRGLSTFRGPPDASKYGQDYVVEDLCGLLKPVDWPVYPRLR